MLHTFQKSRSSVILWLTLHTNHTHPWSPHNICLNLGGQACAEFLLGKSLPWKADDPGDSRHGIASSNTEKPSVLLSPFLQCVSHTTKVLHFSWQNPATSHTAQGQHLSWEVCKSKCSRWSPKHPRYFNLLVNNSQAIAQILCAARQQWLWGACVTYQHTALKLVAIKNLGSIKLPSLN